MKLKVGEELYMSGGSELVGRIVKITEHSIYFEIYNGMWTMRITRLTLPDTNYQKQIEYAQQFIKDISSGPATRAERVEAERQKNMRELREKLERMMHAGEVFTITKEETPDPDEDIPF